MGRSRPDPEESGGAGCPAGTLQRAAWRAAIATLPRDQEVIAYCRGRYCVLSFEAIEALRQWGFRARRLEDGFPEWRSAGLPVAVA